MKKIVISTVTLLSSLLAGCGQKKSLRSLLKRYNDRSSQSTLPVLENANNNTVVTKTLVLPVWRKWCTTSQTITYKGKAVLDLNVQQKRQVSDELQKLLPSMWIRAGKRWHRKKRKTKMESVQAARKIPGLQP